MPVGPTRRAESSTSMPPPEPRSSTVSPSCRSATAVGIAAAERRERARCRAARPLAVGVQTGAERARARPRRSGSAPGPQQPPPSAAAGGGGVALAHGLARDRRVSVSSAMRTAPAARREGRSSRPTGPRRSESTRPASRSFLRWCESVGWEMSNSGTSSHTQTLPACLRRTSTSCSRTGSPSALATAGHAHRLLALDVGVDDRLAARLAGRALGLRRELQIDGHLSTNID